MAVWLTSLVLRLRATFSHRHDRELREELQLHLQLLEDEYASQGLPREEARRHARHAFGNSTLIQEDSHDLFSFRPLEELLRDVRYAAREMRRRPWFTTVAVLSLAAGIGAFTTTFTLVDAFMLRSLPVRQPERLIALSSGTGEAWSSWPYAFYLRVRDAPSRPFDVAAVASIGVDEPSVDAVRATAASANYFHVLGVQIPLGGSFRDDEREERQAVISHAFWRRWFAGSPDVLKKTIELRGISYRVVGVTGPGFTGHRVGEPTDVWLPLSVQRVLTPSVTGLFERQPGQNPQWLTLIGRLRDGVAPEQAARAATTIRQVYLADKAASLGANNRAVVRDASEPVVLASAARGYGPERESYGQPLMILFGLTGLVLLVACANFTNLLLGRSETQQKEFAIRAALGGGRPRLVRQAATECMLLVGLAGAIGLLVACWASEISLTFASLLLPLELTVDLDQRTVAFAGICTAVVLLFGLWPCTQPARAATLAVARPRRTGAGLIAGRAVLVIQFALCTVLMMGAGLLLRTVLNLRFQNLGFDRRVVLVSFSLPNDTPTSEASTLLGRLVRELSQTPGILGAGASGATPLDISHYWIDGSQSLTTDAGVSAGGAKWTFAAVGPGLFEALGMPLVAGRPFSDHEANAAPSTAVIINQALAAFLFGDDNPVGRRIRMHPDTPWREIVGVVGDARQVSPRDTGTGVIYVPLTNFTRGMVAVRSSNDHPNTSLVARHVSRLAPGLTIGHVRTVAEALNGSIARERLMSGVSLTLALIAIGIGSIGLYALMSYEVVRRTHELGIRLALGATQARIARLLFRDTTLLVGPALAAGLPAGVAASRVVSSHLYGVERADPWTLLSVAILLTAVAMLAVSRPARSASRIDPLILLRHE